MNSPARTPRKLCQMCSLIAKNRLLQTMLLVLLMVRPALALRTFLAEDSFTPESPVPEGSSELSTTSNTAFGKLVVACGMDGWSFPDSDWLFSCELTEQTADAACAPSAPLMSRPGPQSGSDEQLLRLIRQMPVRGAKHSSLRRYNFESTDFCAAAVTQTFQGTEFPLSIVLQWPAEGGKWTSIRMHRGTFAKKGTLLPEAPAGARSWAVRTAQDGTLQYEVVQIKGTVQDLRRHLIQNNWRISRPKNSSGTFHAHRQGQSLEFSFRDESSADPDVLIQNLASKVFAGKMP